MPSHYSTRLPGALAVIAASAALFAAPAAHAAWEPTKPVEFVVPAGTGGGPPAGIAGGVVPGWLKSCGSTSPAS